MYAANQIRAYVSAETLRQIKAHACYRKYGSCNGFLLYCTMLKRPPEGGRKLPPSNDCYYWAALPEQSAHTCEKRVFVYGVIRSAPNDIKVMKATGDVVVTVQSRGVAPAWTRMSTAGSLISRRRLCASQKGPVLEKCSCF